MGLASSVVLCIITVGRMKSEGKNQIWVFCDGACSKNPGPGGWAAIIWDRQKNVVRELSGSALHSTNNLMELEAARQGLMAAAKLDASVTLFADSRYVLNGLKTWLKGWEKNNWIKSDGKPVLNKTEWVALASVFDPMRARVELQHVEGHGACVGNNRVDELAVAASKNLPMDLYQGPATTYPFDLTSGIEKDLKLSRPVYLSLVDGQLLEHSTWGECEARVKGKKAKFKKVASESERKAVLNAWGLKF